MDATELADALVAWAEEVCPDLRGSYDHDPETKTQPLPDVACIVNNEGDSQSDPALELEIADFGLQQTTLHTMRATLLFMVNPDDAGAATETLQGFVRSCAASLRSDRTLGNRVPAASPTWGASYDPPFVEFDDSTKARVASFTLAVSELIPS